MKRTMCLFWNQMYDENCMKNDWRLLPLSTGLFCLHIWPADPICLHYLHKKLQQNYYQLSKSISKTAFSFIPCQLFSKHIMKFSTSNTTRFRRRQKTWVWSIFNDQYEEWGDLLIIYVDKIQNIRSNLTYRKLICHLTHFCININTTKS